MSKALLVIDVQNEYFTGKMPISYPEGSFGNILKAIDFANDNNMMVILIQHSASSPDSPVFAPRSDGWKLKAEIVEKKHDMVIEKLLPGSFTGTNLESTLNQAGVKTVTICGYMTQMCCDTTARQAVHLGYTVEFLSDATGTLDVSNYAGSISAETLHKAILAVQASGFSKVMTTDEWVSD
jgi:nicotinamidase-related amidase